MGNLFAFPHLLLGLFFYVIALAVVGAALYFVVRLAVLHALKAHTRWVDQGKS
ncbi:hypothetical protein [Microbacterium sp. 69-10]|uniref:hypothetical protein n=1 Tax=Microbacterium sp. 69-10 TaxID=1895783 RepID=UPI000AF7611B|nr:hypothetical protein [Microbacterium sp. 69-10]